MAAQKTPALVERQHDCTQHNTLDHCAFPPKNAAHENSKQISRNVWCGFLWSASDSPFAMGGKEYWYATAKDSGTCCRLRGLLGACSEVQVPLGSSWGYTVTPVESCVEIRFGSFGCVRCYLRAFVSFVAALEALCANSSQLGRSCTSSGETAQRWWIGAKHRRCRPAVSKSETSTDRGLTATCPLPYLDFRTSLGERNPYLLNFQNHSLTYHALTLQRSIQGFYLSARGSVRTGKGKNVLSLDVEVK